MRRLDAKWLWLAGFVLAYLALRVFWLTGDSGLPSMWEYGYHVTDEGYYLSGGKELYLWGSAVDFARGECLTYGYAAGMHWLSYLAHCLFGLSTWAWRLPFFAIYLLGAILTFAHVARRSGSAFAFATCLSAVVLPLMVVYERTASNDTLMAALILISYVLASGKGLWRIPAAALVVSFIILVKPAVWALMPIPLAGVLLERKTRSAALDAALFVGSAVALVFGWKALVALTVSGDASRLGMSSWAILKGLTANYGLPNFFDLAADFRAFAAFPRDPSYVLLGPIALLVSALPLAFFFRQVTRKKWNAHLILYIAMPAYAGAVSVMNTLYTHYYIPAIALLPIVLSAMQEDLDEEELTPTNDEQKGLWLDAALLVATCAIATCALAMAVEKPRTLQLVYSRIYNLPASNPWTMTGVYLAIGVVSGVVLFLFRRGIAAFRRDGLALVVGLFAALSVTLAAYPALHASPYIHAPASKYLIPMILGLLTTGTLLYAMFLHPGVMRRPWFRLGFLPVLVALTYLLNPAWRSAAHDIFRPATHVHAEVAAELAKLVPPDAVVIGERTDQAFLSLPIRTAATFISNSDPIPVIEALWKRDPKLKLYAFADSQHAYNLKHYRKHRNDFELRLVKTFKMPSFATGKPADVHLCQIIDRRGAK